MLYFSFILVKVKIAQLSPTPCDPMDYTIHGILQARILEWLAFPFSRGSSQRRDWTKVSHTAGGFFTSWATSEVLVHIKICTFRIYFFTFLSVTNIVNFIYIYISSVQLSHSIVSDSLRPHKSQHASMSITNSWSSPKLMCIKLVMPSSHLILCHPLIFLPQSLPASGSFPMSQLFTWGGQSIGVSASVISPSNEHPGLVSFANTRYLINVLLLFSL